MKLLLTLIFSFVSIGYVHASELAAESGEDVFFRGWQYRTDIVQSNIDRYNNEMGGNVDPLQSLVIILQSWNKT